MAEVKAPEIDPNEAQLKEGEPHPSAQIAFQWYNKWVISDPIRYAMIREAIASTALSGNRIAELCNSTMNRLEKGQPVSDRYFLGLCWFVRDLVEQEDQKLAKKKKK